MRKILEQRELDNLSIYATKSKDATRRNPYTYEEFRTDFQIDRDKIYHCTSFRRLMHKTQVFISPMSDHYRTRLTHTLEVSQIARSIARGICANEDLTEAIAIGHDLGHTPFGHTGEEALNNILKDFGGFKHNKHSVRVCEVLERDGKGLNLTFETLDGIENHGTSSKPKTIEGEIVRLSDKIAYVNHDIEDAIRGKLISAIDLPQNSIELLGDKSGDRIGFIIQDVINNSMNKQHIEISNDVNEALYGLRKFLFQNVYSNEDNVNERNKIEFILFALYNYFMKKPQEMPEEYISMLEKEKHREIVVCDYIAGMTDRYATNTFNSIYIPKGWI
ncbi:MAG: deoxyguanosinetriphosphate triphosphohydrolase [Lachnospirales bacterium]